MSGPASTQAAVAARAAELFGLGGKTALVTGANRGIGRTLAEEMARMGAKVVLAVRDTAAGQAVADEITAVGGSAVCLPLDLDDEAAVADLMARAQGAFGGRLDILVNNAGAFPSTDILETTAEAWDEVQRVNLRGPFLCLREAARLMRQDGLGGQIVNVSSIGSILPAAPVRFAYNAAKAALNRLTQDAAAAFAADRIRVNAVLPGPTDVGRHDLSDPGVAKLREAVVRKIPLKRWGAPEDIAAAVIFLASPASAFITGQMLVADGGTTLGAGY